MSLFAATLTKAWQMLIDCFHQQYCIEGEDNISEILMR